MGMSCLMNEYRCMPSNCESNISSRPILFEIYDARTSPVLVFSAPGREGLVYDPIKTIDYTLKPSAIRGRQKIEGRDNCVSKIITLLANIYKGY